MFARTSLHQLTRDYHFLAAHKCAIDKQAVEVGAIGEALGMKLHLGAATFMGQGKVLNGSAFEGAHANQCFVHICRKVVLDQCAFRKWVRAH